MEISYEMLTPSLGAVRNPYIDTINNRLTTLHMIERNHHVCYNEAEFINLV